MRATSAPPVTVSFLVLVFVAPSISGSTARAADPAPARSTRFVVTASGIPIGTVVERTVRTASGFRVERSGRFDWLAGGRVVRGELLLREECLPGGGVGDFRYEYRLRSEGTTVERKLITVSGGDMVVTHERSGVTSVDRERLPVGTLGATCLLLTATVGEVAAPARAHPILLEEYAVVGRGSMSHTSRDDGSHLVVLDVTLEDGTEIRERALLDAGGAIIEAASPTAGIRYLRSDRAPESDVATRAPAPIRADLLGTHAVSSRALAEATAVTVRLGDEEDGERVIHRGREPSPAIRPHVDRVLERTRTAMSATPGATCVDYARAARRGLNDAGVPARLVTGWVAFAGEWRVHRWLEVRDGSDWIGVDPALNQRAIDATHVPLVHHSSTAVDISEIVLETVLVAALGAPPRVLRVER